MDCFKVVESDPQHLPFLALLLEYVEAVIRGAQTHCSFYAAEAPSPPPWRGQDSLENFRSNQLNHAIFTPLLPPFRCALLSIFAVPIVKHHHLGACGP